MDASNDRFGARETILVVHPDADTRTRVKSALRSPDRSVFLARSARDGVVALRQVTPDLVLVGMQLSDVPGMRAIDVFREETRGAPVIALATSTSVDDAVAAIRHGAADYLPADADREALIVATHRCLAEGRTRRELARVQDDVRDQYGFSHLLTQSPRMLNVFDQIRAVAATNVTALILGETGTGKELVSRAIHQKSKRRDRPFISVNCGAFAETLLESELFGHEKGSFTGAQERRQGLFEMADGGTLFLDELGETSPNVQVNLLRVLETMAFRRVGGREEVHVDVRIVAATHVDLDAAVESKKFREDLYYRLNIFPIELPPLRARREDIPLLMRHFLDEIGLAYDREPPMVSEEALDLILAYRWPGNVRQLRALCERWVIVRPGKRIEREHLPAAMTQDSDPAPSGLGSFAIDEARPMADNTDRVLRQIERAYLYQQLRRNEGRMDRTAEAAGISRRTLYTKMKLYSLDAADFRRS